MSASHYVTSLILSVSSYLDRCSAGPTGGRQATDVMQAESLTPFHVSECRLRTVCARVFMMDASKCSAYEYWKNCHS